MYAMYALHAGCQVFGVPVTGIQFQK